MKVTKYFRIFLLVVLFILAVYIGIYNNMAVVFQISSSTFYRVPLYVVIIGSFLTGAFVTWLYLMVTVLKSKIQVRGLTKKLNSIKGNFDALTSKKSESKEEASEESSDSKDESSPKDVDA